MYSVIQVLGPLAAEWAPDYLGMLIRKKGQGKVGKMSNTQSASQLEFQTSCSHNSL